MKTNENKFRQKSKNDQLLEAICAGNENLFTKLATSELVLATRHPSTLATPLHLAVIHEKQSVLAHLVKLTPTLIDDKDIDGRTALHYAAALVGTLNSSGESLQILLKNGAREQITDGEGYTAENYRRSPELLDMEHIRKINMFPLETPDEIAQLINSKKFEALESIILSGNYWQLEDRVFPLECRDIQLMLDKLTIKCLAIQQAVVDDDLALVKHLVDMEKFALSKDSSGATPLHNAVAMARKSICEYLLLIYPNCVNSTDRKGRTPLHYAYELQQPDEREIFITMLVNAGANEDITDSEGFSPQQYATKRRQTPTHLMSLRFSLPTTETKAAEEQLEQYIMNLDFDAERFMELEDLQIRGKLEDVHRIVAKHLDNERLIRYLKRFRKQQNRLNAAMMAIAEEDLEKLQNLVDSDLVEARNAEDSSSLICLISLSLIHVAVCKERHEMVEYLANAFPKSIDILDVQGRAAIHYAATQKNAIYDTLVDCGANELLLDASGITAAQYRENPETTLPVPSPLMSTSAGFIFNRFSFDENLYDPDPPRETEINEWLQAGDVKRLEQILLDGRGYLLVDKTSSNAAANEFLMGISKYQSKINAIHKAVEEGDIRRMKSLIDREQLCTARDRYGMTPLHTALLHGQTNTVRYLLARYPSCVNAADHAGRTALHYASADPTGEHMIKLLQKAGADAFAEDKLGHTPFYYRTHGRCLNVKMLKDNAIMNELISGQMNRPLLQDLEEDISDWIHTGNVGKLEELVLNGYADLLLGRTHEIDDPETVNFLDVLPQYQAKINAIHKAIENGDLKAIKMLVDRKKMAFCRDVRHLAPLHKALLFGQTDAAKYLIKNYPQSTNAMDQNKRTPLHYAAALRDGGHLYKMMRRAGADPNVYDCNGRPPKYYLKYPGEINLQAMKMDRKAVLEEVIHNRVAPSYLDSNIRQWIRDGNVGKLEQLVLSGCGDLLLNHTTNNPDSSAFLEHLSTYLEEIEEIHRTIREGNLERVKKMLASKKLALARNRRGCTPLHSAIVYEQTEIIRYIVTQFPAVLNAPDYNKRTAMHYAAATRDGGHYLKILSKAGANPLAMDNEGRTPDYYRRNTVINLNLMKEDDQDTNLIPEELMDEAQRIDTSQSVDSASVASSLIESARLIEQDEMDRCSFERYVSDRIELPASDNCLYLARAVAPILTKAIAEVLLQRPPDPIIFISEWLMQHHDENL